MCRCPEVAFCGKQEREERPQTGEEDCPPRRGAEGCDGNIHTHPEALSLVGPCHSTEYSFRRRRIPDMTCHLVYLVKESFVIPK